MLLDYKRGQTSIVLRVKILDSSVSTGAGKTGLTSATSGLIISTIADNEASATTYTVAGSTIESITTLGTYATPTATKCRFKEVDATNHKGVYEIQLADARFAVSSAKSLLVSITGASNAADCDAVIPLRDVNPYDAVRFGMTALPNANAEAAGGLYTRGSGAGQINQPANGQIDANTVKVSGTSQTARDLGASVLLSSGTGTGQLDFTSGVVKSNLTQILGTALTETSGQIAAAFKKFFNIATPASTMDALTLVATATNLTNAPTAGDFTSTMKTSLNAATPAVTVSDKTGFALTSAYDPAKTASQAGDAMALTSGERTTLTGVMWAALTSGITTVGSIGKRIIDNLTGDIYARLGAPAGASVSADIAAVKTDTAAIKTSTDNLPASPAATGDIPTAASISDAVWEEAIADHDGTAGSTAEALSNAGSAGMPPTAADIADAVWDETLSDHLTSGTTGAGLNAAGSAGDPWATALPGSYGSGTAGKLVGDSLDAAVSSRSVAGDAMTLTGAYDAAKTAAQAGDVMKVSSGTGANQIALASGQVTVGTNNDKGGYTASTVSDKTGYALTSAYDAAKTAASSVDYTTARAAKLDDLDAAISTRLASSSYTAPDNTSITAIKAKTDNLPVDPADASDLATAFSALNNITASDVVTALFAEAYEGSETFQDYLRLSRAVLVGKANGGGTTTMHFRDVADAKNRVTATVTSDGDRTAVITDAT